MLGKLLCWLGIHVWEHGNDGFGEARWCERCGKKQILTAEPAKIGGRLIAVNMRWVEDGDN